MPTHRARRSRSAGNVRSEIAPRNAGAPRRSGGPAPRLHRRLEFVVSGPCALLAQACQNRGVIVVARRQTQVECAGDGLRPSRNRSLRLATRAAAKNSELWLLI